MFLRARETLLVIIVTFSHFISYARAAACDSLCNDYNNILVACNYNDNTPSEDDCVCNSDGFAAAVAQCITCVGTDSPAGSFQKVCQSVAPDCTSACNSFGLIISDCGDTSAAGFKGCVCSSAYDATYGAFNEAFNDCVTCENGGGNAGYYEAYCCANGYGCNGISAQASAEVASISVASPTASTTTPAPSTPATSPVSSPTPSPTKNAAAADGARFITGKLMVVFGQAVWFWI